jgi:putative phosphoribosyl transferase
LRLKPSEAATPTHVTETIAPFPNLSRGGAELAAALPRDGISKDVFVLAIVSAGVPGAVEVAKHLEAPLDLVIIRRLLAPQGPGSQAVAVTVAGTLVIDKEVGARPAKPQTPLDYFVEDALNGLTLRTKLCRAERPSVELAGKPLLIFDCAMRTGLTMKAAIQSVRTLNPASITAAVPVTSDDARRVVEPLADELVYLAAPEPFGNAGVWYKDFRRMADEAISQDLRP